MPDSPKPALIPFLFPWQLQWEESQLVLWPTFCTAHLLPLLFLRGWGLGCRLDVLTSPWNISSTLRATSTLSWLDPHRAFANCSVRRGLYSISCMIKACAQARGSGLGCGEGGPGIRGPVFSGSRCVNDEQWRCLYHIGHTTWLWGTHWAKVSIL